jgi:signal transduction histidine kinase
LKTPLTSIINYIDLLKTEGMDSENATKYLEILEQKSQRLKNLTEDLVEASKLNSGVAIMELEKLDLVQLVNQSLAEYEERFAARNLQLIKSVQEEPMMVMADGRKTWRLLDNLYNNVSKYAMPGTRVYVDLYTENGKAVVAVKNISENALNINAEELMERFVRGEASRTTEGSGLGLSIAKSIAQRQSGDLEITLDGDLFKVTFEIDLYKE